MAQAPAAEGSKKWINRLNLRFDHWLVFCLVAYALMVVVVILPWQDHHAIRLLLDEYLDIYMLSLVLIALLTNTGQRQGNSERWFWILIIAAYSTWLLMRIIGLRHTQMVDGIFGDIVYFSFYMLCLLAVETFGGAPGKARYAQLRYILSLASNVLFCLGIFGYFIAIPVLYDQASYRSWLPSQTCFIALDLYLAYRFFLAATNHSRRRWQVIMRLLGYMALMMLVADAIEMCEFYTKSRFFGNFRLDLVWALPYLIPILASRVVDSRPRAASELAAEENQSWNVYDRLFLVAAFCLPVVHVLGHLTRFLSPSTYLVRSIFIMVWLSVMIVLLVIQYTILHRRNRMLESLRLRNVRILEAISKVQSHYIAATDSPSVFENMLEQLLYLTESEYGFVGEILRDGEGPPFIKTLAMAYVSTSSEGQRFFAQRGGVEIHDLDTLFGAAVTTGSPVIANDPATYPRRSGFPVGSPEPRAFLGIPLYHREKLIGMCGIANRTKGYDSELLKYLEPLSTTCAGIISAYHGELERKHMGELASRFGRILDDSLQEIYIFDSDDLHFLQVNRGARENIGYTEKELNELTPEDLYPETGKRFRSILQPLLDGQQSKVQYTTTHRRKDGSNYPVDVYLQKSVFGTRTVFVAIALDITERKRMEKEKKRLEAQIIQSQKLETIGTLAGGIAHDFNNILAPIIWYTEMIVNDQANDNEVREDLRHVLKAANRAKDLVQQILTFGRLSEVERCPVQVQLVLEEAVKLLRASLPATIEIERNIDPRCEPVLADPTQIHQVAMNLCTNAYHAMRQTGGVLRLGLRLVHLSEADVELRPTLKPGRWVELTVADTGHGMDPTTMDRIFEPFFTTKRVGEGTGLGLSVIHGIVMTHGGTILVSSKPGQGSTFSVYLPPFDYDAAAEPKGDYQLEAGSERILFVDDEDEIVRTGRLMLERFGYQVTATTSSQEALRIFREQPENFDLVITDQTMPQLTGMRLAEEIRALRAEIPVVLTTGFSEEVTEDRWKQVGINRLVMKPVVGRDLHRIIRSVLED